MATRTCEHCGTTLRIPPNYAGRKGRCPGCGAILSLVDDGPPEAIEAVELEDDDVAPEPMPPPRPDPARTGRTRRRPAARGGRRGGAYREPEPAPRRGGGRGGRHGYEDERPSRRGGGRTSRRRRYSGGSSDGTTVFVLGLLGLLLCSILSPIAWMMGNTARDRCRRDRVPPDGMLTAGWVLGIIGTILLGLSIVVILLVVMMAAAS